MKQQLRSIGYLAALLLCLAIGAVLLFHSQHPLFWSLNSLPLFGAVTIAYKYPVTAAPATPPTASQMKNYNTVRAQVIADANGDTDVPIIHNMGLTAAELALAQPEVILVPLDIAFYASIWKVAYTDGDTVTITKSGAAGGTAGAQVGVIIKRPHSIQQ